MASDFLSRLILNNEKESLKTILSLVEQESLEVDYIKSLDEWDSVGNPPLHVAIMSGRVDLAKMLIDAGASCLSINRNNWTAMDEAAILGDRNLLEKMIPESFKEFLGRLTKGPWASFNRRCSDFDMTYEIKLKSKIPGIAKICPKEKLRVRKSKDGVRIDWNISKIIGFKIHKAPMSLLVRIDGDQVKVDLMNNEKKTFEPVFPFMSKNIIHELVESLLKDGIVADEMPIEEYVLERVKSRFPGSKKDRTKVIKKLNAETDVFELKNLGWKQRIKYVTSVPLVREPCTTDCYDVPLARHQRLKEETNNDNFVSLEALQYITEEDIPSADNDDAEFRSSDDEQDEEEPRGKMTLTDHLRKLLNQKKPTGPEFCGAVKETIVHEDSTATHCQSFPPIQCRLTESDYFRADGSKPISSRSTYEGIARYSRDTPISLFLQRTHPLKTDMFLPVVEWLLERVAPASELQSLASQLQGFPVRVEIPIIPSLKCRITLLDYKVEAVPLMDEELLVPEHFKQDEIYPFFEEQL